MAQIKSEAAYRAALKRIDELLPLVNDETPTDDKNYLELDMISDMVEEYEDVHYPIGKPTLIDIIKLRLYEMGINQTKLAGERDYEWEERTVIENWQGTE